MKKSIMIATLLCMQGILASDTDKAKIFFMNDTPNSCRILAASQMLPARDVTIKSQTLARFEAQECGSFCLELFTVGEHDEDTMGTYAIVQCKDANAKTDVVSIKRLLQLEAGKTYSNLQVQIKRNL